MVAAHEIRKTRKQYLRVLNWMVLLVTHAVRMSV